MSSNDPAYSLSQDGAESALDQDCDGAPLDDKEAALLILNAPVAPLFALLKQVKFELARERIFAGFRVSIESLKTPLARTRLVSELIADSDLADAMRSLPVKRAETNQEDAKPLQHPAKPPRVPKKTSSEQAARDQAHNREIRLARQQIDELTRQIKRMERELGAQRESSLALRSELATERNQNAWRERKMRRLERELADAHSALAVRKEDKIRPAATPEHGKRVSARAVDHSRDNTVIEALDRLISRDKLDAVELAAEEILHANPASKDARLVRARLRVAQGRKTAALDDLRFVFDAELAAGEPAAAATTLVKAKSVTGAPDRPMAQQLFAALSKRPDLADRVAAALEPLEGTPAYHTLAQWCLPPLRETLFPAGGSEQANGLPAAFLQAMRDETLSAKRLAQAIDRGDADVLDAARRALAAIDKEARDAAQSAFTRDGLGAYFRLIARKALNGAAVVDGSNVANFERDLMNTDKPILANILAVRDALRGAGYFPIAMIADANLPFLVDQADRLRQMADRGEIEIVTSGTDADEVIVREARRLNAIIVSNDYMADWDPNGETEKVQFSISLTDGRATLYR